VQKVYKKNSPRNTNVIVQNKVARFYGPLWV